MGVLRKLFGMVLGTVLCLALLEGTLWLLFVFFKPEGRGDEQGPRTGERRIVCIGDSNTYGTGLAAADSYPGRLQTYLDLAPDQPWRVVNLGYPGQNTAQIRARLAENLRTYDPEVVIVWAGVNTTWSPAMGYLWDHPDSEPDASGESLLSKSRSFKALRMILTRFRAGGSDEQPEETPQAGNTPRAEEAGRVKIAPGEQARFTDDEVREHIKIDLRRIASICEDHGSRLVLGEYFIDLEWIVPRINQPIHDVAEELGIPVLPLRESILAMAERVEGERMIRPDHHATAVGNMEVARQVLLALIDFEVLEPRTEWTSVPPVDTVISPCYAAITSSDEAVHVQLVAGSFQKYEITLHSMWSPERSREGLDSARAIPVSPQVIRSLYDDDSPFVGQLNKYGHARVALPLPAIDTLRPQPGPHEGRLVGWRFETLFSGQNMDTVEPRPLLLPLEE